MSTPKKALPDRPAGSPRTGWSRPPAIAVALAVALSLLAPIASSPAATTHPTRVPFGDPRIPTTMMACYHRKTHRFTAEVHPGRCEVAGIARGSGFSRFPIKGEWERIEWNHWGSFHSATETINRRTGNEVRVTVYRRVKCGDGSTWYSRANIFGLVGGFYAKIRLPVCGGSLSGG
jgi:hypothetical protein